MIYIHCTAPSEGAALLAEKLREMGSPTKRSRAVKDLHKRIKEGDTIIGWGELVPFGGELTLLNPKPVKDKFQELTLLDDAGIPVPPFDKKNWGKGWIGRSLHHQEGSDFLPPGERPTPGFYTRKLEIIEEYRFHIFKGKSIRAGKKVKMRENAHPWVRSWQHGWKISYGAPKETFPKKARELAKAAIKAVGYDFGAVDVGKLRGGEYVVLETASRPGFEVGGQTVVKYAEAVRELLGA